jgi:hypothetical protein
MRKTTLALCLTLLAILTVGSPGPIVAGETSCLMSKAEGVNPAIELFGRQPMENAGCRISCNTDFNVYCTGSGLFTCDEGIDSGGYYIRCDDIRYYCPPCPSGNPYDCLD